MRATFCGLFLLLLSSMSLVVVKSSNSQDSITAAQSLHDGQTLVSASGNFELGFFSPGSSMRRYVGIWFKKIPGQTVIWVANRNSPLLDSSGILQFNNESVLVLVNSTRGLVWSTNSSKSVSNPVAQLLDSGNLVVSNEKDDNVLWQSFDYPCDSQLPGMKIGSDFIAGFNKLLTSWKSSDDPSPGSYTYMIDPTGYPQPFLSKDNIVLYRDGPWNGLWFSGTEPIDSNQNFEFSFNSTEMYYTYDPINTSKFSKRFLNPYGNIQRQDWNTRTQEWATVYSKPIDSCDNYGSCGSFSSCDLARLPHCQCMKGFVPKSTSNWSSGDWNGGCVRSAPLSCNVSDGFIRTKCLQNCSCLAYSNLKIINGGSGCLWWINTIIDLKLISGSGQDLYVKVPSSELGSDGKKRVWIAAVSSTLLALVLLCAGAFFFVRRWRQKRRDTTNSSGNIRYSINKNIEGECELPIYDFYVLAEATNNFSYSNKVGEGGFGSVYKGLLSDGQEIAVKRLSMDSRQGLDEFKNEVIFIAKLQHRNLVKLLGCCIEAEERLLIYEYMPNKSLDCYIFDPTSKELLDWSKRLEIINGIARGLLYLHQDSRLRIVHRDLKASNILLDSEMNAKISDFGLARSFNGTQDEALTKRVVGTYGYMPPEYAIDGLFSVKSDVFSFGVIILEIISGEKNRGFIHADHHHSLLGHAWMLFKEGVALGVANQQIRNSNNASEMVRLIQIGLLCVQQHPEDRPNMSLVSVMLNSDSELPEPKEPGFYVRRNFPQDASNNQSSTNYDSISMLVGR